MLLPSLDSLNRATRWAVEMPAFRRQQIQNACQSVLVALGYDEADSFEEAEQDEDEQGEAGPESSSLELSATRVVSVEDAPSRGQGWRASASASSSFAAPVAEAETTTAGVAAAEGSVSDARAAAPGDHDGMEGGSVTA